MSDATSLGLDRVLSAFERRTSGAEPLSAAEIAEELGCVRRTAYAKLQALVERGDLATKKVGARARVWWRSGTGADAPPEDPEVVLERVTDAFYAVDEEWRMTYINEETERTLSASGELRAEMLAGEREWARVETGLRTASGDIVPVEAQFRPLPSDGSFRGTVGVVRDTSERQERQRQMLRQRDELQTLHRITELVYEVIGSIIEAETRETVKQLICDRLVQSAFYQFALLGRPAEQGEGYDDLITAGLEEDIVDHLRNHDFGEASPESATAAYFDDEVRVVERSQDAPELTPGVRSAVGVPISHQGTTYGVLVVGSSRPDAFGDRERTAFELLGRVLGHTFDALETKQSLYADRTTELTFESEGPVAFFSKTSAELSCRFTHQSLVPVADADLVQYVTLDGTSPDAVHARARDSPHISSCRTVSSDGDQHLLEFRTSTSGVAPLFDSGCRIVHSAAEDGRSTIVAEVASSADVQGIVDSVTTQLPGLEIVAKRTDVTPVQSPEQVTRRSPVTDELTDKQAAALRAAYFAGYYNWPRDSTAEEVADALGIVPSTFHQHLRKAQSHLTAAYLDAD